MLEFNWFSGTVQTLNGLPSTALGHITLQVANCTLILGTNGVSSTIFCDLGLGVFQSVAHNLNLPCRRETGLSRHEAPYASAENRTEPDSDDSVISRGKDGKQG